jgi:Carboxypeptidase regulatory-like domain
MRKVLWVLVALVCATAELSASDGMIRGVVADNSGKPIRGAIVKASRGDKTIARYSQDDGRYEIAVPAERYQVTAEAFGYAAQRESKDTAQPGDTNFSLAPRWNVFALSGAELAGLVPDDAPAD